MVCANYPKVSNSVLVNVAIEMNSNLTYSVSPKVSHVSIVLFFCKYNDINPTYPRCKVRDGFLHFLGFVVSEFEEATAHFLGGLPRVFFSPGLEEARVFL